MGACALESTRRGLDWEHRNVEQDSDRCNEVLDGVFGTEGGDGAEEVDEMGHLIVGDVVINQASGATAPPGGAEAVKEAPDHGQEETPSPAVTAAANNSKSLGQVIGQMARTVLLASIGGTVLGAALSMASRAMDQPDAAPAAPPPVASAPGPAPERIPPPRADVQPASPQYRRITIGP